MMTKPAPTPMTATAIETAVHTYLTVYGDCTRALAAAHRQNEWQPVNQALAVLATDNDDHKQRVKALRVIVGRVSDKALTIKAQDGKFIIAPRSPSKERAPDAGAVSKRMGAVINDLRKLRALGLKGFDDMHAEFATALETLEAVHAWKIETRREVIGLARVDSED